MPRAAVAIPRLVPGTGTYSILSQVLPRLENAGWDVHLYASEFRPLPAFRPALHRVPLFFVPRAYRRTVFSRYLDYRAKRERYDLVWGHGDVEAQDVLSLHNCVHATAEATGAAAGRSRIARFHEALLRGGRFRRLIANSNRMKDDVVRRFGVPPERISVAYPGHDPERFSLRTRLERRGETRRALGLDDGETCVGLVTSGDFVKRGVDRALQTLARLDFPRRNRVRFLVLGRERKFDPYLDEARKAGIADRIRFLGTTEKVEDVYAAMDIMLYPARYEEFGLSVAEAAACGVPVLTTPEVGATELFTRRMKSELVFPFDADRFARRIEALMESGETRDALAREGGEALRPYSWDAYFSELLSVFRSASARAETPSLTA